MSTYVATGVFISTLASVTASKSTSASTGVSTTVSTSVYNISSANFPISVSGTASFLTQANTLSSKSTSTAANLLSKVSPTVSPYNPKSLTLTYPASTSTTLFSPVISR